MNQQKPIRSRYVRQRLAKRRWLITVIMLSIILIGGSGFAFYQHQQQHQATILEKHPIRGCLIDQEAGSIDFQNLAKQNLDFVYIKATTGATYFDDRFNINYDLLRGTNLKVGIVHEFSFDRSAKKQMQFISRKVKSNTGQLPVVIAVDYYGEHTADTVNWKKSGPVLRNLVRQLANYYGQKIIIKTTRPIQQKLTPQYIKQSHFWLNTAITKPNQHQVDFIEYDSDHDFVDENQKLTLPVSYFTGSKSDWQLIGE